jgi:hypothetical protein
MSPYRSRIAIAVVLLLALGGPTLSGGQDNPAKTFKVKVTAEQANLREKPDIGSAIVQQIPEGTVLEADKKEGEWYLVRFTLEDGGVIAGYIHESLVVVLGEAPILGAQAGKPAKPEPEKRAGPEGRGLTSGLSSPRPESVLPIDIFLSAGGSTVIADDFNKGVRGLADFNGALLGAAPGGSVNALRLTYLLGVEVFCRLSPWISVGLGVDYLNGSRSSRLDYLPAGPGLMAPYTAARPSVQAVPVKLGVRFYPRPDFYLKGSLAYYTVKAGYDYLFAASETSWQEWKGRATAHAVGLEVAVGGEWELSTNLFFFAEAGFRLARVEDFSGTGTYRDSAGADAAEQGPLWYYQGRGADGLGHNLLFIQAAAPTGTDILGARKAGFNLTGTAVKAGVKFRF